MHGLWLCLLILAATAADVQPVTAAEPSGSAATSGPHTSSNDGPITGSASRQPEGALERIDAFEHAYAASFYEFDACGDGIAGRIYRSALVDKLKQCPFSSDARKRFQARSAAQRQKSSQAIAKLIEENGGLPIRLAGMTRSCREQADSSEYRLVRGRLEDYAAGRLGPEAVVDQPCDATEITP